MKLRPVRLFTFLGLFFLISAVVSNQAVRAEEKTRTFTDMLGRKVTVPEPLNRVALLGGPTGQIAYVLGARQQLCAVTKSLKVSGFIMLMDPTIKDLVAPRSTNGQINVEELIVADPQLVIAGDFDGSIVEKKTHLPVAYFKSDMRQSFESLKAEMRFYGAVFQKQARAEKYIQYLQKTLDLVKTRTKDIPKDKRKTIFNGYSASHLVTLGGDTFMHNRLELAGCRNAAESISSAGSKEGLHIGLAEVSMEKVLGWNPDILVIDFGEPAELYDNPKWKTINAVKNKMIFKQPVGVFIWDRPTAESAVLHPLWLAKIAYPERFADINLVHEIKNFYREIMAFNLTDEQAEAVLSAKFALSSWTGQGNQPPSK